MRDCPKPVIAAIDGPAAGLGVELVTQCDFRIASTRAGFSWIFVQRGLVPDTGASTWLLPQLINEGSAKSRDEHLTDHILAMTECQLSDEHREGVAAFLEKRPAVFAGR